MHVTTKELVNSQKKKKNNKETKLEFFSCFVQLCRHDLIQNFLFSDKKTLLIDLTKTNQFDIPCDGKKIWQFQFDPINEPSILEQIIEMKGR